MGNELYVKLAKESGLWDAVGYPKEAVAFANLVAAHEKKFWMEQIEVECNEAVLAEREACAKVAESVVTKQSKHVNDGKPFYDHMYWEDIAAAIRARSNL